jgi:hypothetical protein
VVARVPALLVESLRLGVGHASTVRPDPSTLAWWENEAPATRTARSPSQALAPDCATSDRYGHLYPEADAALRDRLDALYGTAQPAPEGTVVRLHRQAGRGPNVAPGGPGNNKSAADDAPTTL